MAAIDVFKQGLSKIIGYAKENASRLSSQAKAQFAQFLRSAGIKLQEMEGQEPPTTKPTIPDAARLLWVAANGDLDAFTSFIHQFPDASLQSLKENPNRLLFVIKQLQKEIPRGSPTVSDGIKSAWLPSSNIWGYKYDKNSNRLFVKFNGKDVKSSGSTYVYEGVPKEIVEMFSKGSIPAKTTGSGKWGSWFRGKSPSLGASHHQLLKKGGYSYRRIS